MNREITVRGTGKITVSPDQVILYCSFSVLKYEYDDATREAAAKVEKLTDAFEEIGFKRTDLKTLSYDINTKYESYEEYKVRKSRFKGYSIDHRLKLEFDLDQEVMRQVFHAIAKSKTNPSLDIEFTVKDKEAVNEQVLHNAALNAKKKAAILTEALGVELGDLVRINYSWNEIRLYSESRYELLHERSMSHGMYSAPEITPEDINVSDEATFIWEIK